MYQARKLRVKNGGTHGQLPIIMSQREVPDISLSNASLASCNARETLSGEDAGD